MHKPPRSCSGPAHERRLRAWRYTGLGTQTTRWVGFHLTTDLVARHVDLMPQEPPGGFEAQGAKLSLSPGAIVTKYHRLGGLISSCSHSSGGAEPQIKVLADLVPGESP